MKRDRGLINFDCSNGATEGGLTVSLHYIICRNKSTDQYIANLELHEITYKCFK